VSGMARQGDQHRAGECGNPGPDPGRCILRMPGQRGAPPAAASHLVTARATHEPPAGRRPGVPGRRTGLSACIPHVTEAGSVNVAIAK